ncbi:MAG TPA: transcriptional regulator GcvA [Alphaproteobacteria bacterium]
MDRIRRLPPLNSLRAFEAAARHLSFQRAAAELHVTPAAISHQVKALEAQIGVKLFRRLNRAVRLTEHGQACLPVLRDAFDRMAQAVEIARAPRRSGILTVSAAPSFAARWLVPRLDRFRTKHPDIDLRVSASMHLVDFAREDIQVGLRYGHGRYPGLHVELLMRNEVFPVCSPKLLKGRNALRRPDDLQHHVLLHDETNASDPSTPDWPMWLRAAGVTGVDATRGLHFNHVAMALEAAVAGRGVALAHSVLVRDDLAEGRLVRPFALSVPVDFAYYFVCPPEALQDAKIRAFREWILAEARATMRPATAPPKGDRPDPAHGRFGRVSRRAAVPRQRRGAGARCRT